MLSVAILAAGKGTRMESSLPKVLHKISGKSLLQRVIDSCVELNPDQIFVITGHKSNEVQKSITDNEKIQFVIQDPQSGTGHAIQVLCTLDSTICTHEMCAARLYSHCHSRATACALS